MNKTGFDIDVTQLEELIKALSGDEVKRAQVNALRKAARPLYDAAKRSLVSKVKGAKGHPAYYYDGEKTIANDTLLDAVRMVIGQNADMSYYFKVHTMGTRKKGSGTFITRFFEGGTVPRKTKKGQNRGSIKPTNFFTDAVNGSGQQAVNQIEANFYAELDKIIKQYV